MFPDDDDDGQNNISLAEARSELGLDVGQTVSTIKPWKYLTSQLIVTRGTSWSSEVTFLSDPPARRPAIRLNDLWENFQSQVWGFHHHISMLML